MNKAVKVERRKKQRPQRKPFVVTKKVNRKLMPQASWAEFVAMLNRGK
jgi:hypothetical protein